VLTVGSTQFAAKAIGEDFRKTTDHTVTFTVTAPFLIDKELAGKSFDAVIVAVPQMEALDKAGQLRPGSRVAISRVGVGVVVREGAPMPDISTPEAFKQTMLAARSITYSDPAIPNLSGGVATEALRKAGILDQIKPKVRIAMLGPGADLIIKGEADLGFFNLSEVLPGLKVVGPVPAPLQGYTFYEMAVLAKSAAPAEAASLIKLMASVSSSDKWRAAALEPVAAYQPAAASR
jgi:molybdate transport system substrate-binding protein